MAEVLRRIPSSANPSLLVGFETSDDAGIFMLSEGLALVQTVDFFTPVVDDPYAYGQIAAANALSDVYAMGGRPLTVLNIACFSPAAAPPEVWAEVLRGMADKTIEAGAVVAGGHSVEDAEPKFGMAVTGLIDPARTFANTHAQLGDEIWLSKPLGTGIVTTAAKNDAALPEELEAAIDSMRTLNRAACEAGLAAGVRCATDITGFGLAGHLFNVAKGSGVTIEIDAASLPVFEGVERMIAEGHVTGGAGRNREFLGDSLRFDEAVPGWLRQVVLDPQTSGGLALFSRVPIAGAVRIGRAMAGDPRIHVASPPRR
ncbi:selenide, water dikinase [Fimbriimonas ginsengisoli Gsoil 348]|uniref:Selenide, water dikinase n=1 Tax=Fimbriimonas ginsengisoli Gsoil 348 TaxID=661478 RepID=A0A068NSJ6_FIMGI|nr:selenide, water dikinase [Fimbriimonas ginsengisoli Gsoil 348]